MAIKIYSCLAPNRVLAMANESFPSYKPRDKEMKQTLRNQTKRASITLAAVGAFAAFGTALAAPPPPTGPTFASASITIEPRGEAAGGLTCSWRETGLGPYAQITYACDAGAVGVLEAC